MSRKDIDLAAATVARAEALAHYVTALAKSELNRDKWAADTRQRVEEDEARMVRAVSQRRLQED